MLKLILPAIHLFGLIGFILYKTKAPFLKFVSERQRGIFENLNKSKIQAASLAERKKEIEAKLVTLDSERAKILADWKEKESKQVALIKESSARVITQMRQEAEQNKITLEASVKNEMLVAFKRSVLNQAQQKIIKSLAADTHKAINDRFVEELSSGVSAQ